MELEVTILMKNKNKGFTLIELLVALTVFSLVIISMSAIAVSMIKAQRKAFALQNIQEPARYIVESISKEIRMSVIDSGPGDGLSSLSITNSKSEDVDYQFVGQRLRRRVNGGSWQDLSPTNLEVTGDFYIRKSTSLPVRAVVTLIMQVKSTQGQVEEQAEIYLQSTISSRAF